MAYAIDLGSIVRKDVGVRLPPRAPCVLPPVSSHDDAAVRSPSPDRKSVPLRERPQLLQREPAATAGCGDQDAGPYALRARRFTSVLSALPPTRARATQRLRTFVGDRRPSVWIPRTQHRRDPRVLHSIRLSLRDRQYDCIVFAIQPYCRTRRISGHITQVYE
jgi:hypothetical protein